MRKFAPAAIIFGVLSASVLAGVGTAQAGVVTYDCNQIVGVNTVSCNEVNLGPIKISIDGNRVLTVGEVSVLENNLNNVANNNNVTVIKNVGVDTYKSFNPSIVIAPSDVNVCIASVCS